MGLAFYATEPPHMKAPAQVPQFLAMLRNIRDHRPLRTAVIITQRRGRKLMSTIRGMRCSVGIIGRVRRDEWYSPPDALGEKCSNINQILSRLARHLDNNSGTTT